MFTLRPYQEDAKASAHRELATHKSTLVEMATGLGKTVLFAHIADEWAGRVLVIAHREELITQAAEKVFQITGRAVAIEMGRSRAEESLHGTKVTVGSIQTLAREKRRGRFHPDHFGLLIIDEGHHAPAKSYREVLDYFGGAKKLFVTATPKRADGVALGGVCESVAYQYGIEAAIDDGWLVPVKQTVVQVDGLDFSKARTVAQDFNQADLDTILTQEEPLHRMVASAFEIIGNKQALWFCNSVAHARATGAVLGRYAPRDSVRFLSGETPSDIRQETVREYKAGRIQHLLNCALFLEGFDAPATAAIVMGRPTKSLGLYMQILGRGTRPLPGVVDSHETATQRRQEIALSDKPDMTVIDFAGNAGRHKIVQAADVLGGKYTEAARAYAKNTLEREGNAVEIEKALERAREELLLEAEESEMRRAITGTAAYSTYDVDPFVRQYAGRQPVAKREKGPPCSGKQAGYICYLSGLVGKKWKYQDAAALGKKQAGVIINRLRKEAGL